MIEVRRLEVNVTSIIVMHVWKLIGTSSFSLREVLNVIYKINENKTTPF